MSAKEIDLRPIERSEADACVREWHYSGKPYVKSRLHMGVFYRGRLMGALQWGPSIDTRKMLYVVPGTRWDGYLELNRMALSDALPRFSESRSIAVALRLIKRHASHIEWIVSYSDATQCGDGAIYRAAGMELTQVRSNTTLWLAPDGRIVSDVGIRTSERLRRQYGCGTSAREFAAAGLVRLRGYQIRYMKFLQRGARERYAGEILPFSDIPDDARMVRGVRSSRQLDLASATVPPSQDVRSDPAAPYIPHQARTAWQSWESALAALPDGEMRPDPSCEGEPDTAQIAMGF